MFEKRLKQLNPNMRQITYDINDLYTYIDSLPDLSALVYSAGARAAGEPYSACICRPRWQPLVSAACAQLTLASLLGGRSGWAPGVPRTPVLTLCTNTGIKAYVPHDKEWLKTTAFAHLKRQAA